MMRYKKEARAHARELFFRDHSREDFHFSVCNSAAGVIIFHTRTCDDEIGEKILSGMSKYTGCIYCKSDEQTMTGTRAAGQKKNRL
jgi:hypothetical protein